MSSDWRESASCAQLPIEIVDDLFFLDGQGGDATQRQARRICARCDVIEECREYATVNLIPEGVFGGETGPARRRRLNLTDSGERRVVQFDPHTSQGVLSA